MKYILSVSEYINYTKYILEVRFYLFCQMISFCSYTCHVDDEELRATFL